MKRAEIKIVETHFVNLKLLIVYINRNDIKKEVPIRNLLAYVGAKKKKVKHIETYVME